MIDSDSNQILIEMRNEMRQFNTRITSEIQQLNTRFDQVDARLDKVETRLDQVEMVRRKRMPIVRGRNGW
jgi:hypothetical protein